MPAPSTAAIPHTRTGWVAVALGYAVLVVGAILFFLSHSVTSTAGST